MMDYVVTYVRCLSEEKLGKRGQGMVEYALILAFVVVLAAALTNSSGLKTAISGAFTKAASTISSVS